MRRSDPPFSPRRRRLLQAGAAGGALAAAAPLAGCQPAAPPTGYAAETRSWRNWSGSQKARPGERLIPASEDELARWLPSAVAPVRPVGASHSFSALVNTDGTLLTLDGLKGVVRHDPEKHEATLWAGTRIREAAPLLEQIEQGFQNQGDVDPQSLAGAIATSTHGTGVTLGSFSSTVRGLRLVTSLGEIIPCTPDHDADVFHAAACSLGALGVVSQVTLQNRKAYRLRERSFAAPLAEVLANLETWRDEHRHFEFWAFFEADTAIVKFLDETGDPPTPPPDRELPVDRLLQLACDLGHGLPLLDGPVQRLLMKHFPPEERVGASWQIFPSARRVRFNEMEYEVPAAAGPACLEELRAAVRRSGVNNLFPLEYRFVAADECWLSPFYRQDSASISIHQYHEVPWQPLFRVCEPILRSYGGRPHWGKLHSLGAAELAPLYPRWDDFQRVRNRLDPGGRMLNAHLRQLFGA